MTATTPDITKATQMPQPPTPPAEAQAQAPAPSAEAPAAAAPAPAAAGTGRSRWAILGDHPVLTVIATGIVTLFATLSVAMLVFVLNSIDNRIDRLEDTMYAGFAEVDEINLKLTALIAALNKTEEVDAALEGRLLDSEPAADDPGAVPG